jgi:carbonic anhydrase/acetyltransferase-like protein (isoleucine patch superfamily)
MQKPACEAARREEAHWKFGDWVDGESGRLRRRSPRFGSLSGGNADAILDNSQRARAWPGVLCLSPAISYGDSKSLNRKPDIRSYRGKFPQIAASAYIDPAAVIIGDVVIGEESSVWPMCVVRGDVHYIRIGNRTNIQDGCVLHVMKDQYPLVLADEVTVGHSVTLHGCMIESRVLVGMGAVVLNGAVVGGGSIIAAGTLVTERTIIPPGSLVLGTPGKVQRALNAKELESIGQYAERYAGYREIYRKEAAERGEPIDWSGLS